ncbi:MAG: ADP-ribosylglycohydrolase family protein, partial [Oscillospiraceae bacterium]
GGIAASRPPRVPLAVPVPEDEILLDKIQGAWLGRCAGCLLGQPVEGWDRARIRGLLEDTENLPIRRYLSSALSAELRKKHRVDDAAGPYDADCKNWINNVRCMPEDDDTNYTILGLKLLERRGTAFTSEDAANFWLMNLPLLHTCSAERVAYVNFCNLIPPPKSAVTHNPYREWIGAQIRADIFGYVCPGNPEKAAALAWKEARISHVKNGVYGAMLVSAMLAAASVEDDLTKIVTIGLGEIPASSRLAEGIRTVLAWHAENVTGPEAIDRIHAGYDETYFYDWCHTVPNAMLVCLCLLYGDHDFTKTIGMAVEAGFDTDCNGATAGSILGMVLGAEALPAAWTAPLNDRIYSAVHGFYDCNISDLAKRTLALVDKEAR